MRTVTSKPISHRNGTETTKTTTAIHCAAPLRSALDTPQGQFVVAAWLEWIFGKVADIRRCNLDRTRKDAICVELIRRAYSREDAIAAEMYLLTAEWTAAKNGDGIEISDFFRDKVEISKAELTAMRHKSFKKGLEEGKRQNTSQMFVSEDEKPLLDAITACQKQNFELLAKISRKDSLINRLLRRLDRANIKYDDILTGTEFAKVPKQTDACLPMLEEGVEA